MEGNERLAIRGDYWRIGRLWELLDDGSVMKKKTEMINGKNDVKMASIL